jgi:hypothetical protein
VVPSNQTAPQTQLYQYSHAVQAVTSVPFAIAPNITWDSFCRIIYDRANETLQRQANALVARGNITVREAAALVSARNDLVLKIRARSSPFGELYAEIIKPRSSLKTVEQFLAQKGTIEAVMQSLGKTRAVVDKIAVVGRVAGPSLIVLQISLTALVIAEATPDARGRVAAREVAGLAGSVGGGFVGMWAGCIAGAALASPSLVVPIVGEVTTGGACFVGGIISGLGLGYAGQKLGSAAGAGGYDLVTKLSDFKWTQAR